jgi:hypothetical protein
VKSKPEVPKGARDLRFDTLRGLLLVCMTINHLPTELRTYTDQSLGLFSAAEGFVFLSGLIAGWVYTRKLRERGREGLRSASMGRAKSIYAWHIAAFLTAFICVQLTGHFLGFCSTTAPRLFFEHPLESLGLGLSLLYQPGLLDLLPMYCAFVLLLPVVINSLEAGRRWLVLGVSGAVWLSMQWAPDLTGQAAYPINTGTFNLFAWQFLFVAGITIGHARISGAAQVAKPSRWVMAAAAAVGAYGIGLRHGVFPPLWPDALYGVFLNKPSLGLLRMADFGCVAYLLAIFGERFPRALVARPLALLGQNSLPVVAAQSVAVVTILQFSPLFVTALGRTLTAFATIGILFAAAAAAQAVKPRPSGGARQAPVRARQSRRGAIVPTDGARAA